MGKKSLFPVRKQPQNQACCKAFFVKSFFYFPVQKNGSVMLPFLYIASECRFWPGLLFIYRKNNRNMGKYLHHFTTTDDFANEYLNEGHQLPWVSYNDNPECEDMKKVVYNQMNYDAVVDMRDGQPQIIYDNVTNEDFGNPHNLRILVICDNCQIEEGAMTFDDGTYTYYMQNYGCSVFCYLYGSTSDIVWDSDCGGESEGCAEGDMPCQCEAEGGTWVWNPEGEGGWCEYPEQEGGY